MDNLSAIELARKELYAAQCVHPLSMPTFHDGYAVILEELDELWTEIKKKHPDVEIIKKEARQVAAMALRFLVDLT